MKLTIRLLFTASLVGLLPSCTSMANDTQLEQMCNHLIELRGDSDIATDLKQCVADAKNEGVTEKQAACRISAVNKTEYWVRCRTGEAR